MISAHDAAQLQGIVQAAVAVELDKRLAALQQAHGEAAARVTLPARMRQKDFAALIRKDPATVCRMARRGDLKLTRDRMVPASEARKFLEAQNF